jgi:hypothetical protein
MDVRFRRHCESLQKVTRWSQCFSVAFVLSLRTRYWEKSTVTHDSGRVYEERFEVDLQSRMNTDACWGFISLRVWYTTARKNEAARISARFEGIY